MTISPQEVQQILSEPPYEAFIPYEEFTFVSETKPTYKEIEKYFGHVMMDLELTGERKIQVLEIPKSKRWDFYCEQVRDDTQIPSPTYLIDCIKKKHDPRLLESLAVQFSKYRISYRQQFLDGGGLQLLLNYIRKFSEDPNSEDNQKSMPYVFECLQNISNSIKFGPSYFENDIDEIFPILMDLMIKLPFSRNFILILSIISGCFISATKGPILTNVLKTIKLLKMQPPLFWNNLKKTVEQTKTNDDIEILNKFTQMLLLLRNNPKERIDLVIMFEANGYIKSIRGLSNSLFSNSISQYDSDYEAISQFSKHLDINPFSTKSLLNGLKKNSRDKCLFRSILLSLNDILTNYEASSSKQGTYTFLHNFLLIHRYFISQDNTSKISLTAFSASSNSDSIKIPYSGPNLSYRQLNDKSLFLNDATLKTSSIANYGKVYEKMPDDTRIPVLNKKIEEYQVYIKKLKEAHHIANSLQFEQESVLAQLKSLRTENLHLKALAKSLADKLEKYERGDVHLIKSGDQISIQNNQILLLKDQIRNLEDKLIQESKKNLNLNRQNEQNLKLINELKRNKEITKSVNIVKTNPEIESLRVKLEESNKEKGSLASRLNESIREINNLKLKIDNLNSQLKIAHDDKENLKLQLEELTDENQHSDNADMKFQILKSNFEKSKSEAENLRLQLEKSSNDIKTLKAKLVKADNDFKIRLEESENEIKSLKSQLFSSVNENNDLKKQIQSSTNSNKGITTRSLSLKDDNDSDTEVKVSDEEDSDDISSLRSKLDETKNVNKELQKKLIKSSNENEELKLQIEQFSNNIEKLKNEIKTSEKAKDKNESELNLCKTKIGCLESQLTQLTETNVNLRERVQLAESENNRLRNEEIDSLKSQLESSSLNDEYSSLSSSNLDSSNFSPLKQKQASLAKNSFIVDQLASQQQQIQLLKKMLSEYESKEWGQLNPSYDLKNANSDEIATLREELEITKEKLKKYIGNDDDDEVNSDAQIIEVLKEQLNQKKIENEQLKTQLTMIEKHNNELKSRLNENQAVNNNNNGGNNSHNNQGQSKRRFSFLNIKQKQ